VADPVRVGEMLGSLPGLADRLAEARLVERWPEIAGPAGTRSRAEGIDQGVLQVAVDSSGWLHRLTLEEPRLITRCREIAAVRGIRFRLATPPAAGPGVGRTPSPGPEGEVHQ
jgi:predicted nucleic acid-binding Zn ribbon protein